MAAGATIPAGRAFVKLFADDEELRRGLKRAQSRMRSFASELQGIGAGMTAIGGAITGVFAIASRQFAGFDDSMRAVGAVTGASAEQMSALREEAQRLGRTTSFTAKQVADAMTEMGRAGFVAEQILASSDAVLALARATSTDLPRATEIGAAAMRGFNLEAEDMPRIADVLTATANKSAQTLDDLFEAMKVSAPIAVEAGESIEDVAAAIGVMANNGIKGSLAGTALARAYKNLATEAKQADLADIGVQAVDATGDLRPMVDILNDIADAVQDMGSAQRLSIFENLFGRGQAAALKLAGDTASVRGLADEIRRAGGVAQETASQMDAGLGGAFRKLRSAAEGILIALGDAVADPLSEFADSLADMSGKVTRWAEDNRGLVVTIASVGAGLTALGITLIATGALINALSTVLAAASLATKGFAAALALLSAHPAIAAMTAIAAAAVAVGIRMKQASDATLSQAEALSRLHERQQRLRDSDRDRVARLQELGRVQRLNDDQMDEARSLLQLLTPRYSELNVVLDETTRRLEGAAGAMERFVEAGKADRIQGMESELRARQAELAALEDELAEREQNFESGGFRGVRHREHFKHQTSPLRAEIDRTREAVADLQRDINELQSPGAAQPAGDTPQALPSTPATAQWNRFSTRGGDGAAGGDGDDPSQPDPELERRVSQLRLQLIDDRFQREVALINERYDRERQAAQGNAAKQKQLDEARYLELRKLEQAAARDAREEMERAAAQQEAIDQRAAEAARRRQQAIESANQSQADRVAELHIRTSIDDEYDQALALLDLREKIAVRAAQAAGENLDLVREEFDLLRELEKQRRRAGDAADTIHSGMASIGSLGGQRIEQIIGGRIQAATGRTEDRTARATEATAEKAVEMAGHLQDMSTWMRASGLGVFL